MSAAFFHHCGPFDDFTGSITREISVKHLHTMHLSGCSITLAHNQI